jgi:hypothetical protein
MFNVEQMRTERRRLESMVHEGELAKEKVAELDKLIALYGGKTTRSSSAGRAVASSRQRPTTTARTPARGSRRGPGRPRKNAQLLPCPVPRCTRKDLKGNRGVTRHVHNAHPEWELQPA